MSKLPALGRLVQALVLTLSSVSCSCCSCENPRQPQRKRSPVCISQSMCKGCVRLLPTRSRGSRLWWLTLMTQTASLTCTRARLQTRCRCAGAVWCDKQPLAGQQLVSTCMHQRLSGDTQGRHDLKGVSGLTGCSAGTDLHGPCACSSHSVVPLEWAVSKCISASVDSLAKLLQSASLRSMLYSCILK